MVERVWQRAFAIPGEDPDHWRRDDLGALICREEYGDPSACFGWVIEKTGSVRFAVVPADGLVARHWRHAESTERAAQAC